MAQIGTVRLETQNSGAVDVPVFEPGDSASGIYEFVRVETASGPGFIPVTDPVDATYPYLRVQSQNNGIVAVTDTPGSDIPDSGVARYRFENSVQDSWNDYDGVDNTGLGYTSSSQEGSASKLFDTSNAGVDISTAPSNQSFTFVGYIYFENDVSDKQHFGGNGGGNGDSVLMRMTGIGGSWRFRVAGTQLDFSSNNIQTDSWINIGFGYDASTGTGTVYEDGSILDDKSYNEGSLSSITDGLSLGAFGVGGTTEPLDGRLDDVRYYSKRLSGTEYSNLYNTGSISG